MPNVTRDEPWLRSESPCEVVASGDLPVTKIWFKKRVDKNFCFRVTQLQLCTDSFDRSQNPQTRSGTEPDRDWTWFELAILEDETSVEPKLSKEGKPLVWPSHSNRRSDSQSHTRHFGATFDRRCDILVNLEVGDVIAVRACARYPGSVNYANKGYIHARVLDQDLFTPHRWTLSSDIVPTHEEEVEDGSYSFVAPTSCLVKSNGNELTSQIWFTTPALEDATIRKLESIQLFTSSRYQTAKQEPVPEGDRFSWFDLVILETPFHTVPRVENGISLVWKSHANESNALPDYPYHGQRYDVEDQANPDVRELACAMKGALKAGNAIGVRVNAQYPGWENYARAGQIIVRISNDVSELVPQTIPEVAVAENDQDEIRKAIEALIKQGGIPSATTAVLSNEIRADTVLSGTAQGRSLRLLSLDGGGVRGVSPLRILQRIMDKVAKIEGKPGIKPWTSTGGLIALMLGRLEMTIEECEESYDRISREVFGSKAGYIVRDKRVAFAGKTYLYKPEPLVEAVKSVVSKKLGDREALMLDPKNPNPRCKVMVMSALATKVENGNRAIHLRTYNTSDAVPSETSDWKIWEAARATSAAPVYFPSFERGKFQFVDGGLGFNNPTSQLLCELISLYGWNFNVKCLLSLGTGTPPEMRLGQGLGSVEDYIAIATNSEDTHLEFLRSSTILPTQGDSEKYWRFNMNKAQSGQDWATKAVDKWWKFWSAHEEKRLVYEEVMVEMDDWTALDLIRELTDKWLDHGVDESDVHISARIDACAARISRRN